MKKLFPHFCRTMPNNPSSLQPEVKPRPEPNQAQSSNQQSSLLADLKKQTTPLHNQIEASMNLKRFMNTEANLQDYSELIANFHSFIAFKEKAIQQNPNLHEQLLAELPDLESRFKTPLLVFDLAYLNKASNSYFLGRGFESIEEVFGYLYVMEGSTLGGTHIAKALKHSLGASITEFNYFESYKEQTVPMWRTFCNSLESYAKTPEQQEAVIASAKEIFKELIGHFSNSKKEI
jgi:heme oxygenase (biliverdin-IX-beta and delta-forming)